MPPQRSIAYLVSFTVITHDPERVFTDEYRTGLFMFCGCATVMRREVLEALGGYDCQVFVWAVRSSRAPRTSADRHEVERLVEPVRP